MIKLFIQSTILFFRLIWLQSSLKKKMIFFVRLQATPQQFGWEVGDPVLAVRISNGLTGLRGTSLLGTEFSLTIV